MVVTFVTAFIDLEEPNRFLKKENKNVEKSIEHFKRLVEKSGPDINFCVFTSFQKIKDEFKDFKNIYFSNELTSIKDLWVYGVVSTSVSVVSTSVSDDLKLPPRLTDSHDTRNFMILMNSKAEFVNKAIEINPFPKSTHYAWIDFSICHVVKNDLVLKRLYTYSKSSLKDTMLLFPTCWPPQDDYNDKRISEGVYWRFCGGFFIGDKHSLQNFYKTFYQAYFESFLREINTLVWEVNYWAWLEKNKGFNPEWYLADHNDSILMIPSKFLKTYACITTIPPRFESCKKAVNSLLKNDGVDKIFVSVSTFYERFGTVDARTFPTFESDKVILVKNIVDYGPATKYIGALDNELMDENTWLFFGDDDQEYSDDLISRMKNSILFLGAYQNRFQTVRFGSGGIIHGFVGNMFHSSFLKNKLQYFELPPCARFVDDQWMSIFCFFNRIPIFPTMIESYKEIFSVLRYGVYEQVGEESLAALGNRDSKVKELAEYFKVKFLNGGSIVAF